ncbi:hypothetical protein ACIGB8_28805 [Promicromonospora sukumoe]|uniref:hypothetical protein n=1 Tax=Promicromonospora sukumoe TaxID=88382 RepID=UPI0037C55C5D
MFDTVQGGGAALERARAALRLAERRVGVQHRDQVVTLAPSAPAPLTELLPGGELPRGAVSAVLGSATLTTWLLGATQGEGWVAVVGWPDLGVVALAEAGVKLERVSHVPDVRGRGAAVMASLIDGFEIVVAGPRLQLTASERRRLTARARQHGAAVLSAQPWEGAAVTLDVEAASWSGPDHGDRWLREARHAVVRRSNADGAGRRFEVARDGTGAPTASTTAARAAAARLTG